MHFQLYSQTKTKQLLKNLMTFQLVFAQKACGIEKRLHDGITPKSSFMTSTNPGDSSIMLQQCVFAAGQLVKPKAKINVKVENPLSCLEQNFFRAGQQSSKHNFKVAQGSPQKDNTPEAKSQASYWQNCCSVTQLTGI